MNKEVREKVVEQVVHKLVGYVNSQEFSFTQVKQLMDMDMYVTAFEIKPWEMDVKVKNAFGDKFEWALKDGFREPGKGWRDVPPRSRRELSEERAKKTKDVPGLESWYNRMKLVLRNVLDVSKLREAGLDFNIGRDFGRER